MGTQLGVGFLPFHSNEIVVGHETWSWRLLFLEKGSALCITFILHWIAWHSTVRRGTVIKYCLSTTTRCRLLGRDTLVDMDTCIDKIIKP